MLVFGWGFLNLGSKNSQLLFAVSLTVAYLLDLDSGFAGPYTDMSLYLWGPKPKSRYKRNEGLTIVSSVLEISLILWRIILTPLCPSLPR